MKKTDVLFIRSFTPDFDGRFQKFRQALDNKGLSWYFLGWDRENKNDKNSQEISSNITLFKKKGFIGGGWKNIFNIILWNIFICYFLIKERKNIGIVQIVDFDSALLGFPIAKLLRKKIIFDVYDMYTAARKFPSLIERIINWLEKKYMLNADYTFIVDEERLKQHGIFDKNTHIRVYENVPNSYYEKNENGPTTHDGSLKIGYLGIFEKNNRGLENILKYIGMHSNCTLHIAGFGAIEPLIKEYAKKHSDKIYYYGALPHKAGMDLMSQMDILLGLYYKSIPNHLYASPNKYYEHLMLGKPLLTTKDTPPGNKVEQLYTGWAIEDDYQSLENLLQRINPIEIEDISKNAKKVWENKYSTYLNDKFFKEYIDIVISI